MSRQISQNNPEKNFTIGIVAPYRVQADLIEKLFATAQIPPNIQISASTIHGFQGDECDIIFAVFNPPPSISDKIFLNRQNIINVSISRACDYLFLIMPDDRTANIENLWLIKAVEKLFGKHNYSKFNSTEIEELIFGTENYIEENSFSTGHQHVNIYTKPERVYEIRSDDNAVDIQLHKDYKTSELKTNLQDMSNLEPSADNRLTDDSTLTQTTSKVEHIPDTNLTWTLDDNGTLTISGNGDMPNDIYKQWQNKDDFQKIIIDEGVTSISDYAFYYCSNLIEVIIQEGVTSVGDRAFADCSKLEKIILPASVKSIGTYAFGYCDNLESIEILGNLDKIESRAFGGCPKLKEIKIHGTLTKICGGYGIGAFSECNNLISTDQILNKGVKIIEPYAFRYCENLTSVTIPLTVQQIGHKIFEGCKNLKVIKYPRNLPSADKLGKGNNAKLEPY